MPYAFGYPMGDASRRDGRLFLAQYTCGHASRWAADPLTECMECGRGRLDEAWRVLSCPDCGTDLFYSDWWRDAVSDCQGGYNGHVPHPEPVPAAWQTTS